jgi:hypothetical protein
MPGVPLLKKRTQKYTSLQEKQVQEIKNQLIIFHNPLKNSGIFAQDKKSDGKQVLFLPRHDVPNPTGNP